MGDKSGAKNSSPFRTVRRIGASHYPITLYAINLRDYSIALYVPIQYPVAFIGYPTILYRVIHVSE